MIAFFVYTFFTNILCTSTKRLQRNYEENGQT